MTPDLHVRLLSSAVGNDRLSISHPDPLVQEALDVWTPRFLNGGVHLADLVRTVARMNSWDDWGPAWMTAAEEHERRASEETVAGRELSAAQSFLTA